MPVRDDRALATIHESQVPVVVSQSENPEIRDLIQFLPPEIRDQWTITGEDEQVLAKQLKRLSRGAISEIPMRCMGEFCPMSDVCPLFERNQAPIGRPCPIEDYLIDSWESQLKHSLVVDNSDFTQLNLLHDLVETYVLDRRMSAHIRQHGIIENVTVGISPDGIPITKMEPSAAYNVKMQQKKRKDQVLKQFVATKETQLKLAVALRRDPSTYASELMKRGHEHKDAVEAQVIPEVEEGGED